MMDYILCSENKGAGHLRGTAKLVCAFVFAYAYCWFSDTEAQLSMEVKMV